MGRIVVTEFVSLDGVMEAPGGGESYKHAGWTFKIDRGKEGDKFKLNETLNSEALLLGRVTYEGFAAAWPSRTNEFATSSTACPNMSSPRPAVVLGSGKRLFGDTTDKKRLRLADSKTVGDGITILVPLPVSWTRKGDMNIAPPSSIVDPDATGRSHFIGHAAIAAVRAATGV